MRIFAPLALLVALAACGNKKDDAQKNHQQAVTVAAPSPDDIGNNPATASPLTGDNRSYAIDPTLPPVKGRATPDAQTERFLDLPTGNGLQPQKR